MSTVPFQVCLFFTMTSTAIGDEESVIHQIKRLGGIIGSTNEHGTLRKHVFFQGMTLNSEIPKLSTIKELRKVNLAGSMVSKDFLAEVVAIPGLEDLNMSSSSLSDGDATLFQRTKNLTTLNVSETKITDDSLRHISNNASMKKLDLSYTMVDGSGFNVDFKCSNLEFLDLTKTKVTGENLKNLAGFVKLKGLSLSGSAISDDVLGKCIKFWPNP